MRRRILVGVTAGLVTAILCFAFYVRHYTFWVPHWQGDQHQYVTLAMKLAKQGLSGYHLRDISLRFKTFPDEPGLKIVYPVLGSNLPKGDLIKAYAMMGIEYYDMPFFYKAPLFPMMLAFSHWVMEEEDSCYAVAHTNLFEESTLRKPDLYWQYQDWAVIVPLLASLLTIIMVFFFAKRMFGVRAGLYSMFLMAVHPVGIVTSNRVLTEEPMALLLTVSFFFFLCYYERRGKFGVWVSGVICGYAILTNQKAILYLPVIWLFIVLTYKHKLTDVKKWPRVLANRFFLLFLFGAAFVTVNWFRLVYDVYGDPLFQPPMPTHAFGTEWLNLVFARPHAVIFYPVGIAYLCPPFLAGYITLREFFLEFKAGILRQGGSHYYLFLWLWVFAIFGYFVLFETGREHRYLFTAYPALAMLAGSAIERLRRWSAPYFVYMVYADIIVIVVLLATVFWSVPMAWETIFDEKFLIRKPF